MPSQQKHQMAPKSQPKGAVKTVGVGRQGPPTVTPGGTTTGRTGRYSRGKR